MTGARRQECDKLPKRRQVESNEGTLSVVISNSFPMYGLLTGLLSRCNTTLGTRADVCVHTQVSLAVFSSACGTFLPIFPAQRDFALNSTSTSCHLFILAFPRTHTTS